jgi:hydrogenase nickel incorporation protein HypB
MCATCGCGETVHEDDHRHEYDDEDAYAEGGSGGGGHGPGELHAHAHGDELHAHAHGDHGHPHVHARRTVALERDILAKNDALAAENRAFFEARGIAAFNLTSAPGAGKTTLLEALLRRLASGEAPIPVAVVEGDQETERDAERIRAAGAPAIQINTGTGCHLDAEMVRAAVRALDPPRGAILFVENVGNLVCPALFDLGERAKVVLTSVTEGEDKPLKYPHMFRAAEVLVLTKIDLLPHVGFDLDGFLANSRRVNPGLRVFQLSARDGAGLEPFADWLSSQASARGARS